MPVSRTYVACHSCAEPRSRCRRSTRLAVLGNGRGGVDAMLTVTTVVGAFKLPTEIERAHLGRDSAQLLLQTARRLSDLLVLAPYIGRDTGELFESAKVNFIDTVGNCHIRLDDRYLARVQGRAVPTKTTWIGRGVRLPIVCCSRCSRSLAYSGTVLGCRHKRPMMFGVVSFNWVGC